MNLLQRLKKGASRAVDKAQLTMEITKISSQIAMKRKEIERSFPDIGYAVYLAFKAGNLSLAQAEITRISQQNITLEEEIAEMENQINKLKFEKICECGKTVMQEAIFCSHCGRKFEMDIEEEPQLEEVEELEEPAIICRNCDTLLEPGSNFCTHCGINQ